MAYYNGFPATYQPMYQQPFQSVTAQNQQQMNNGIIWIQGEAGAKSYLVAPNTTVPLWDSESQRIFLKSADASGMPSIKTLEYTIVGNPAPSAAVSASDVPYATKDSVEALRTEIDGLRAEIDRLTTRRRRKEETVDE
jgi:hypothetical protein